MIIMMSITLLPIHPQYIPYQPKFYRPLLLPLHPLLKHPSNKRRLQHHQSIAYQLLLPRFLLKVLQLHTIHKRMDKSFQNPLLLLQTICNILSHRSYLLVVRKKKKKKKERKESKRNIPHHPTKMHMGWMRWSFLLFTQVCNLFVSIVILLCFFHQIKHYSMGISKQTGNTK